MKNTLIASLATLLALTTSCGRKVDAKGYTKTNTGVIYWHVTAGDTTYCTSFNDVCEWSNLSTK